jgi:hypothetical protein
MQRTWSCKQRAQGRASANVVSLRLATAVARVPAQVRACGICGGQSSNGASLLRVLRFALPPITLTALHSSSFIMNRGCYNRPNSGPCAKDSVSPQEAKRSLIEWRGKMSIGKWAGRNMRARRVDVTGKGHRTKPASFFLDSSVSNLIKICSCVFELVIS